MKKHGFFFSKSSQISYGSTRQVSSILNDGSLEGLCNTHVLYHQYRCVDEHYATLLNHLRHWKPEQQFLDSYQEGRVCMEQDTVTDNDIWQAVAEDSTATVLTVSREAADRVNNVVLDKVFSSSNPITNIPCEGRFCDFPVYDGMRVVLTQNRDKEGGFVNGQRAVVVSAMNNTVLL